MLLDIPCSRNSFVLMNGGSLPGLSLNECVKIALELAENYHHGTPFRAIPLRTLALGWLALAVGFVRDQSLR